MIAQQASPIRCLAPGVAVIPVVQQHIDPSAGALHSVAWVVIYEHRRAYIPAYSKSPSSPLLSSLAAS